MPHNFGLLFYAVPMQRPPWLQAVMVTAQGMAHQRQVPATFLLGLPHMRHFVDEQALQRKSGTGKVIAI